MAKETTPAPNPVLSLTVEETRILAESAQTCGVCSGHVRCDKPVCGACLGTGRSSYGLGNDTRYAYDVTQCRWVDTTFRDDIAPDQCHRYEASLRVYRYRKFEASLKTCGNCDGRGYQLSRGKTYRCGHCLGSGRYSYDDRGRRVAWHAYRKAWVRT